MFRALDCANEKVRNALGYSASGIDQLDNAKPCKFWDTRSEYRGVPDCSTRVICSQLVRAALVLGQLTKEDDDMSRAPTLQTIHAAILTIHANQLSIIEKLDELLQQESEMAIDLTAITASAATQTTVDASIMALLDSVTAALAAIPPSTDPTTQAAIKALQTTIDTNNAAIVADVLKNTPVVPTPAAAKKYRDQHPQAHAHAKHAAHEITRREDGAALLWVDRH